MNIKDDFADVRSRRVYDARMPGEIEITTIWRTAAEQCELVIGQFTGYHVRLWVKSRLVIDETLYDLESAIRRARELRVESPRLAD